MPTVLLGRKIGMTRLFKDDGTNVPVTVIQAGPNYVSQIKTVQSDGYNAIQLAFEDIKSRNSTMPLIGHDAGAGLSPKRFHREVRISEEQVAEAELGQTMTIDVLEDVTFVDVTGTSKGKGHAGSMKRWGFKGQPATHGTERKHRAPGSVGGRASNAGTGRPKRGGKKAGQLGSARITARSLEVISRDKQNNLLMVKGAVPGPNRGMVMVRQATRLNKQKGKQVTS